MTQNTRYDKGDKVTDGKFIYEVTQVLNPDSDSPDYRVVPEKGRGYKQPTTKKASDLKKVQKDEGLEAIMEKVEDLSAAAVDMGSQHYDFSTGYPSEWEVAFRQTEEERMEERFMPMMNSLWGLPQNYEPSEDDKEAMRNMTVVAIKEGSGYPEYYLALTGGGMDMSWQIADTYVQLGYLPPAALGTLPNMANRTPSKGHDRLLVEALKESHRINSSSSENAIQSLDNMVD